MIHFRIVCPPDRTDELLSSLMVDQAVINIVRMAGAARRPDGDLVQFDAAPESGNRVVDLLRSLAIDDHGSISIERIDTSLSDAARRAELHAPGHSTEAVIWEDVEARSRDDSGTSPSFLALMMISALIAAIGILTDSPILIVGAMVVGPEYGPISSIAVGIYRRRPARIRRGLRSLAWGLAAALAAVTVLALIVHGFGWTTDAYLSGERPLTSFISAPDGYAVVVAVLAGIAGALSLTQLRSGTLVGVLVSVTTIPAAANIPVALVHDRPGEAGGAALQLVLNIGLLCLVGAGTLALERALLDRRHRSLASE